MDSAFARPFCWGRFIFPPLRNVLRASRSRRIEFGPAIKRTSHVIFAHQRGCNPSSSGSISTEGGAGGDSTGPARVFMLLKGTGRTGVPSWVLADCTRLASLADMRVLEIKATQ